MITFTTRSAIERRGLAPDRPGSPTLLLVISGAALLPLTFYGSLDMGAGFSQSRIGRSTIKATTT
jgi:hypothetical protein